MCGLALSWIAVGLSLTSTVRYLLSISEIAAEREVRVIHQNAEMALSRLPSADAFRCGKNRMVEGIGLAGNGRRAGKQVIGYPI